MLATLGPLINQESLNANEEKRSAVAEKAAAFALARKDSAREEEWTEIAVVELERLLNLQSGPLRTAPYPRTANRAVQPLQRLRTVLYRPEGLSLLFRFCQD